MLDSATPNTIVKLMKDDAAQITQVVATLVDHTDWKLAIGLRIKFANPTYVWQNYPEAWSRTYEGQGLVYKDPTVRWAMMNSGAVRWEDLHSDDPDGVFAAAAEHGLKFGIATATGTPDAKSMAFFARSDRPVTDDEIAFALERLDQLHSLSENI